jgi:hypothetical protein
MEKKNYNEYIYNTQELFFKYLKDRDLDFLIKKLYEIETLIENTFEDFGNKGLWFKFFDSDTLATTIGNIKADLSMPSNHPNHKLMVEMFELAIDLNGEMEIYFS